MIGLEWLRRKAVAEVRIEAMTARSTEQPNTAADVGREQLTLIALTGVTTAEATASLAAIGTAMRRGDPLVACGCWPRYVGTCRCKRR